MKIKQYFILFLIFSPILVYLIFRSQIKPLWEDFDIAFTLISYTISVILLYYNINLKFHFAINKIISWFKQDYTYWNYSYSLETEDEINQSIIIEKFKNNNFSINKNENDFIELIYNESHLFRIQILHKENNNIHLFSNKLIIPSKKVKSTINELIKITELLEDSIGKIENQSKMFDLTIEYPNSSPFYSYAMKKLPEQSIYNFNFSIKVPNNENSVRVNKNQIIISSKSINKLFDTTKDYLSLQIEI